ncbi:MAG TPA: MBL fold metallo-hydrolase [Candidatus Binataceae bacterium]|nr:MBL fold metallo-hydrolase [Candidatus Binataceae bacterium]
MRRYPAPKSAILAVAISLAIFSLALLALAFADKPMEAVIKPNPASWPNDRITISNLGHATVLMNFLGVRIISDPSLFDRVGLAFDSIFSIGPKRVSAPPLKPSDLQDVQLILITHAHMDHLDVPSLKALPKSATAVVCDKCSRIVAPLGFANVRELKWGESTEVGGLKITAMGARHWGKRWPPYGTNYGFDSFVLEKDGRRVLIACDSAYTDLFGELANHPPDIAIFSNGAYDPWIWNHANPEQVWSMFKETGATYLVPIHWGTFRLGREPMDDPMRRLLAAAGAESDRVVLREIGGTWTMPEAAASKLSATAR